MRRTAAGGCVTQEPALSNQANAPRANIRPEKGLVTSFSYDPQQKRKAEKNTDVAKRRAGPGGRTEQRSNDSGRNRKEQYENYGNQQADANSPDPDIQARTHERNISRPQWIFKMAGQMLLGSKLEQ